MVRQLVSGSSMGHFTRSMRDGQDKKVINSESRLNAALREAELLLGDNVLAIRIIGELLRLSVAAQVSLASAVFCCL